MSVLQHLADGQSYQLETLKPIAFRFVACLLPESSMIRLLRCNKEQHSRAAETSLVVKQAHVCCQLYATACDHENRLTNAFQLSGCHHRLGCTAVSELSEVVVRLDPEKHAGNEHSLCRGSWYLEGLHRLQMRHEAGRVHDSDTGVQPGYILQRCSLILHLHLKCFCHLPYTAPKVMPALLILSKVPPGISILHRTSICASWRHRC